ncbi:MAG TPA: 4-hydroxyphenylacetate 3-hydroxylase N-terminal domain-containing protein [Syntrophales bacterium]|nr:4-hydroxyphenylacetate 3-hydroxylase N-terminal domain-containing protein [Syntrophales bacterium]
MMSGEEYLESLRAMKPSVYIYGKRDPEYYSHPAIAPAVNAVRETYEVAADPALDPELHALAVAESDLTGGKINRFNKIVQSKEDLAMRMKLQRAMMRRTGGCFGGRCVAGAVINALWSVTFDVDAEKGTSYHARFRAFMKMVQEKDLTVSGNITDAKGDRSLPPHQQPDPDLFVRIEEIRPDGIVVNGAKLQQSGAPIAHERLIVPTTALGPKDEAYAVAFAVPGDTPGVIHVNDTACANAKFSVMDAEDIGNAEFGMHQSAHIIFDHVFIPNERVFLCGEWKAARDLVHRFSDLQRLASASCRCGYIDLCMGAAMAMADYNGVAGKAHIQEKLVDMSVDAETLYGMVAGSAYLSSPTPSGMYLPETLTVNAAKLYMNEAILKTGQRLAEIGGGILVTRPSERDLAVPKIGELLKKYHQGRAGTDTMDRIKMARLAESLSGLSGPTTILSVIAAGPPATQRLNFRLLTDFGRNRKAAERLAGIASRK